MRTSSEPRGNITIDAVMPRYSCFQDSLDQFVTEFETNFSNLFYGKETSWWDDDTAADRHHGGFLKVDSASDLWEWD